MSRRTAAEVIANREYLLPEFDPCILTVNQLRGVLSHHGVNCSSQHTKSKLVQLFNAEIKQKGHQSDKRTLKIENNEVSSTGIEGLAPRRPINELSESVRNSSRPLSQALPKEHQAFPKDSGWEYNNVFQSGPSSSSPARPPSSRSSLSRLTPPKPPPARPIPARPTPSRPPTARPTPSQPSSAKPTPAKPTPAKPTPAKPTPVQPYTSSLSRPIVKLYRSRSASPQYPSKEDEKLERQEEVGDKEVDGVDQRVIAVSRRISKGEHVMRRSSRCLFLLVQCIFAFLALATIGVLYEYKHEEAQIGFCNTGQTTNAILDGYRARSAAIDSCNRENRTTLYLANRTASVALPVSTPSRTASGDSRQSEDEVTESLDAEACPPPPLIPLSRLRTCTTCPRHAICTPSTITCGNGYILNPHPLLWFVSVPGTSSPFSQTSMTFTRPGSLIPPSADIPELIYSAISIVLDGLPGLGPVALPPRCVEDPRRSVHIDALEKVVRNVLATERGRRLCEGVGVSEQEDDEVSEAKRWGLQLERLKEKLKDDIRDNPNMLLTLDDTFNEVIQRLVQWGAVLADEDIGGKRYLAYPTPHMSWHCSVKVKALNTWNEWHRSLTGGVLFTLGVLVFRTRRAHNTIENKRVATLVQFALDLLREQELAYYTDPVTAPRPYLSSIQLRDLVLRDELSVKVRRRLWERVERIVEGNANVRTNLEEVEGGDELRVWRWVGVAAIIPGCGGQRKTSSTAQDANIAT